MSDHLPPAGEHPRGTLVLMALYPGRTVFDRYGLWTLVAVALVVIAYA